MTAAPKPANEADRLRTLRAYDILDTPREREFDDLAVLAASIYDAPMAFISFLDEDRQWFKATVGSDATGTSREIAFCAHTILELEVLVVPDATQDPRFATNPVVTGPQHIRFYAGAPLRTAGGHALGSICVVDVRPRELAPGAQEALAALARQVMTLVELRRAARLLDESSKARSRYEERLREADHARAEARLQNELDAQAAQQHEAAARAERLASLGVLVAGVAHEVNNPLMYIHGNLKSVLQDLDDLEAGAGGGEDAGRAVREMREAVSTAISGTERIATLVRTLKVVARKGGGRREDIDLNKTLDSIEALVRTSLPAGMAFSVDRPSEEIRVVADPSEIHQIVLNLVQNAFEAHEGSPGAVRLSAGIDGDHIVVSVVDDGPGIDERDLKQIFTPFFTTKKQGTGLGLSIAHAIARDHGGDLTVASTRGEGATFRLVLPRPKAPATANARATT